MAQIGLKNLFYARITEDSDGNETYGTPKRMAKAISADLSINSDNATEYADDGADVVIREFTDGTLTLGVNDIGNAVAAELTGAEVDANGVLISAGENTPPPVAVGFQSRSARGGDRFMWLYRVVFATPNQSLKTKGQNVEFATPSIVGTISRRNKTDASGKHPWKADVKDGDPGVSSSTVAGWFGSVYEPGASANVTLSDLVVGSKTLTPAFDANIVHYALSTTTASETVTATAAGSGAAVAVLVNGNSITNGGSVTWTAGKNTVEVTVRAGGAYRVYTIDVTKT